MMVSPAASGRPPRPLPFGALASAALVVGAAGIAVVGGAGAAVAPRLVFVAVAGIALFSFVVVEPVRAAYVFLGATPLLGGFERGAVLPLLRPSEALLGLLVAAVATRAMADGLEGAFPRYVPTDLDRSIVLLALLSSVLPVLWRVGRGFGLEQDDMLYATTLWKYVIVFAIIRMVVTEEHHVRRCLMVMLGTGVIVAVVAILQSMKIGGVPQLLAAVYGEPLRAVTNNRGTSTLGNSHGVADVMAIDLSICVGLAMRTNAARPLVFGLAALFGMGTLASGQFSAVFALLTAAITLGWLSGRMLKTMAISIPSFAVALLVLRPVLEARFASTDDSGVPTSWEARMLNLQNYFWPELRRSHNWILGVRPAGRLPSFEPWREFVFIESGHTWLLWTGGVPFFLAYLWFTVVAWRSARPLAAEGGLWGVVGITTTTAAAIIFVLMSFDVHLTMRGAADALFPLLALTTIPAALSRGVDTRSTVGAS